MRTGIVILFIMAVSQSLVRAADYPTPVEGDVTPAVLEEVQVLADEMLSNSVIEDVVGISIIDAAATA